MSCAWARPATCGGAARRNQVARLPARCWLPVLALAACLAECRAAGAAAARHPGPGEVRHLQLTRLKHSNLGGYGPDSGEPVLRFSSAATGAGGEKADLVVLADPDFRPHDASGNIIVGGIARVSLRPNSREVLTFKFVTGPSNAAVRLDNLVLSLLLTDPRERVKVAADPESGLASFCMSGTTLLSPVVQQDPAAIVLVPTAALSARGDPGAQWPQAKDSRDTAITLQYRGVSQVVLEVQVVGSAGGGADFEFSGAGPVGDSCVDWLGGVTRRPARPTAALLKHDWGAVLTDAAPTTSCDIACEVDGGVPYTCRQRIRWDAGAKFGGEANACELAHRSVLEECEPCARCAVQDICRESPAAGANGTANASRGLVVPYRCDGGHAEEWAWAPEKARWCCAHHGRGCGGSATSGGRFVASAHTTTAATVTRTQTATQTWTTSTVTTVTKTKSTTTTSSTTTTTSTTTSTSTSTTTTTSTTSTSTTSTTTTPEPFDCLVGFALWVQDWSPAQKRYCCRKHALGCSTTVTTTTTQTTTTTTTSSSTESSTSTTSTSTTSRTSTTNTSTDTRTRSTTSTYTLTRTRTRTRTSTTTRTTSTRTTSRTTSKTPGPTRTSTRTITTTRTTTRTATSTVTRTRTATRTSSTVTSRTATSTTRTGTSTTATRTSVTWTSTVTSRTRTSTTRTTATATSTTGTGTTTTRTSRTQTTTATTRTATTSTVTITSVTATTTAPWDCTSGISTWQLSWSEMKRDWCCKHKEVGCAALTTLTTTGTTLAVFVDTQFDCSMGLAFWQVGWSASKKEWCCAVHGVGCPDNWTPPTEAGQAAQAAQAAPEAASPVTPSDGFDCIAGFAHWRTVWSAEKKAWCCQYKTLGCDDASLPVAPVPLPETPEDGGATADGAMLAGGDVYEMQRQSQTYDCVGDLGNWHQAWSYEQKEWCCQHEQLGCYDCSGAVVGWAPDKLEFCCKSVGTGCDPAEAEPASQGSPFGGWGALGPMLEYSVGDRAGDGRQPPQPPAGVAARLLGGGGGVLFLLLVLGAATFLFGRRLWESPRRGGAAQLYAHVGAIDMHDAYVA